MLAISARQDFYDNLNFRDISCCRLSLSLEDISAAGTFILVLLSFAGLTRHKQFHI
jgi:hypothetical protein